MTEPTPEATPPTPPENAPPSRLRRTLGLSLLAVAVIAIVASIMASGRMRPDVKTREPLPQVALTSLLDGQPYDLEQHHGKVVLLDFWGST